MSARPSYLDGGSSLHAWRICPLCSLERPEAMASLPGASAGDPE